MSSTISIDMLAARNNVIFTVNDFLKRVTTEPFTDGSSNGNSTHIDVENNQSREDFIEALKIFICSLQKNLDELTMKHHLLSAGKETVSPQRPVKQISPSSAGRVRSGSRTVKTCRDKEDMVDLVQVCADNNEINRRIAAFMDRKQREVDDINKREFCATSVLECEDSCARTDAVYIPTAGATSHVKVSRVVNRYGPQSHRLADNDELLCTSVPNTTSVADVEERIASMEAHLDLARGPKKCELFERIKRLEDRILTLESISPEYVHIMAAPVKRKSRTGDRVDYSALDAQSMALPQINERISQLREELKRKTSSGISLD